MKLSRTELFFFNHAAKGYKHDRLELFARVAHESQVPVLVVADEAQLIKWKEILPQGLFSYSKPNSPNLRRNPFPDGTAVLLDPNLSRQHLALLRSKAVKAKLGMTQVS